MPFRARLAFNYAAENDYQEAKIEDIQLGTGGENLPEPLQNNSLQKLIGWIVNAYDGYARYPEDFPNYHDPNSAALLGGEIEDFPTKSYRQAECRPCPMELTRNQALATGLMPLERIPGVDPDQLNTVQNVRPAVLWFDGMHDSSDEHQCIINLTGGVPAILYDYEEFVRDQLERIAEYNKNPGHTTKIVPIFSGHSMGAMIATAIAAKEHYGSVGLNGLGLGRGIRERFVGKENMQWVDGNPNAMLWLQEEKDDTSDPSVSPIYRAHPGKVFRFAASRSVEAEENNPTPDPILCGHFGYRYMLWEHGIRWSEETFPLKETNSPKGGDSEKEATPLEGGAQSQVAYAQ
ncbi:MAG: hypothetical protein LBB14_03890 [Puniceicoccales bacterium]|nr:hypothetical protein [Puniceicoccales bacterium]